MVQWQTGMRVLVFFFWEKETRQRCLGGRCTSRPWSRLCSTRRQGNESPPIRVKRGTDETVATVQRRQRSTEIDWIVDGIIIERASFRVCFIYHFRVLDWREERERERERDVRKRHRRIKWPIGKLLHERHTWMVFPNIFPLSRFLFLFVFSFLSLETSKLAEVKNFKLDEFRYLARI